MISWQKTPLSRVTGLQSGFAFKSSQWTGSGIPVVKIANIKPGRLDLEGCSFVTQEDAVKSRFMLNQDDILIGLTGYVGVVCRVSSQEELVLNQRVGVFRPQPDRVRSDFLYFLVANQEFAERVISAAHGSAQANVSPKQILDFEVSIPPLSEQREIAAILGALDGKIQLNRKTAATLEAMARALYRSWFVDFDPVWAKLEGRRPAHMSDATAALFPDAFDDEGLPVGWNFGTLGKVAFTPRNGVKPEQISPDTPYIGLEHMPRRSIALFDWGSAADISSQKSLMSKGDFLFGKLRPYFHKVGIVPVDGICSTDIVVVRPQSTDWGGFVLGVISSDEFVEHTNAGSSGTRMPRTSWGEMASYEVVIPDAKVVACFERLTKPWRKRIMDIAHENKNLAALRDTLLPKLMSGELRVGEASEILDDVV